MIQNGRQGNFFSIFLRFEESQQQLNTLIRNSDRFYFLESEWKTKRM